MRINKRRVQGSSLVEYAIAIALIAIVVFVGVGVLGRATNSLFQKAVTSYPSTG